MNTLITGCNGFVGSNLSNSLAGNHILTGLDISAAKNKSICICHSWDKIESIDFKKIDVIIHLAGKAHDTKNQSAAMEYFEVNTDLTKKIFDYFLKSDAQKFIQFSSVKAAADKVDGVLTEDCVPYPGGPYGDSKFTAEQYILSKSLPNDKKVYILRPCMIHGPGNKGNLNLLFKMVSKGIPWPLGAFENKRSFTSIENLQYIISEIIENDIAPGIYNVADDDSLSTNTLIKLIAESQGEKSKIWNISPQMIALAARAGDKFHLPLNSERLRKLTESYVVSNSKLKKALDIEYMPISAEEGMFRTINSF